MSSSCRCSTHNDGVQLCRLFSFTQRTQGLAIHAQDRTSSVAARNTLRECVSQRCVHFFERWESLSASRVLSSQCTSRDGVPGLEHVRLVCRFVNGRCQSPRRTGSWRRGVDARPVGLSRTFCDENLRLVARLRLLVPRCDTVNDEGCLHTLHHLAQSEGFSVDRLAYWSLLCDSAQVSQRHCPTAELWQTTCRYAGKSAHSRQHAIALHSWVTADACQKCIVGELQGASQCT